jgi:hypothetical protein
LVDLLNHDISATLKSTKSEAQDFNTPPESPTMPHPLFKKVKSESESMDKPPVRPPRSKRGQKRGQTDSNADLLEAVADDLLKLGTELDNHISESTEAKVVSKPPTNSEDQLKGNVVANCFLS